MKTLAEINAEIRELERLRVELINSQNAVSEEYIKSLEWTKEYVGRLEICNLFAAGLPAFKIHVIGKNVPITFSNITVMGTSSQYEYNMLFKNSFVDEPHFYTSSKETLLNFMEIVSFKAFEFNDRNLIILEAAKRKSEQCLVNSQLRMLEVS